MIFKIKAEPGPDGRFYPGCFDENVGKVIPIRVGGLFAVDGMIIGAEVSEDRSHAWVTIDAPQLGSDSPDLGTMIISTAMGPGFVGEAEESIVP